MFITSLAPDTLADSPIWCILWVSGGEPRPSGVSTVNTDTSTVNLPAIKSSAANAFIYYGEREGWHIALSQHRDSDALDRSNFAVISQDVLSVPADTDSDLGDAAIESSSHFLVGWVEYLLVRPGSSAERRALEWREKLEDYPCADEMHLSEIEWREEWCVRCDSADREQHDDGLGCAKFRSEQDARDIEYKWRSR